MLEETLKTSTDINFVLGARRMRLPGGSSDRYAIDINDIDALSYLTEAIADLSNERRRIARHWFPERHRWDEFKDTGDKNCYELAEHLLRNTEGCLVVLGSDLVNGFVEFAIDRILTLDMTHEEKKDKLDGGGFPINSLGDMRAGCVRCH